MKPKGTIIRKSSYGSTRSPSSSSTSYAGSSPAEDEDDLGSVWNAERTPLIQRTEEEAKLLGARGRLSKQATFEMEEVERIMEERSKTRWKWQRSLKVGLLTLVCVCLTIVLLFLPEARTSSRVITVSRGNDLTYDLDETYHRKGRESEKVLLVTAKGSFVPEEIKGLASNKVFMIAKKDDVSIGQTNETTTQVWTLGIISQEIADFFWSRQSVESHVFNLQGIDLEHENASLIIRTNSRSPVALSVEIQLVSQLVDLGVILGAVILVFMYAFIILEVAHRTVVTMLAATWAIGILAVLDERPPLEEIITWIDIETLTLLFSMMLIVSILSETGVFNYLGFWAFKVTKGRVWPLMTMLCLLTATVSAVLDNVTTILLMTPVIIQLCEAISVDPCKVLIANVIFSNIGGAATAIGDPPNVLIASDPSIQAAGVNFANFTMHMLICVVFVCVICFLQLRLMYRGLLTQHTDEEKEIHDLNHELTIWHRTAEGLPTMSREEAMVKAAVDLKIRELREELKEREEALLYRRSGNDHPMTNVTEMEESCKITDKWLLVKSACVLAGTIILFFMSNFPQLNLSLGWTALLGALTLLVLADRLEVESVFARVEWSTLIFFATLFVVMEALGRLGLLDWIGGIVESAIKSVPEAYQLTTAIVLILWVSGIASAFIDNIPFTTMMIPVITRLAESREVDLPLQPLVWSLALGACLGGNGTLIGASANVVCAGVAEQHGYKFTFVDFFKVGFPITLVSLLVANVYLLICHVAFNWNGE